MRMSTDLLVIGGGIAGLVAARQASAAGWQVTVLEAAGEAGGVVGWHRVDGLVLDSGAESFDGRGGTVAGLVRQVGLGADLVQPASTAVRVLHEGESYPLPGGVLGVPTDLDDPAVLEALGVEGLNAARQDAFLPVGAGAHERTLAGVVRTRMGQAVLDRLVRPVVQRVYSVEPEDLGTEALMPDLAEQIVRTGSLAAALALAHQAGNAGAAGHGGAAGQDGAVGPGGAVGQGIAGGVHRLVDALLADLDSRGVAVHTSAPVRELHRVGPGWQASAGPGSPGGPGHQSRPEGTRTGAMARSATGGPPGTGMQVWRADAVLLACAPHTWTFLDPDSTPRLLEQAAGWPEPTSVDLVTLVLDAGQLPGHDQTGVLVAEPGTGPRALTYASAKWGWVAKVAGSERAVVRLAYPAELHAPEPAKVLAHAGRLLHMEIDPAALRAHARVRMDLPRPALAWRMATRVATMRQVLAGRDGLEAAGSWIAGSGLAAVIPDAQAAAARLDRT